MRLVRKLAVGLAAVMLSASAAMAADPIFIPPPPAPPPMAPAPVAYNWGGPHAGAFILRPILAPPGIFLFGAQAGFNIQRNNLVFGFDARFGRLPVAGPFWIGAGGKVGVALGARGNILVYGTVAGVAVLVGPPDLFYVFGGGAEIGISELISIFAELALIGEPGVGCCEPGVFVGVNFNFGN